MIPEKIALTSHAARDAVSPSELEQVARALQEQITEDFAPVWQRTAVVQSYADPGQVPHGWWPVIVSDDIGDPAALGYHSDWHGQPYALVDATRDWPTTASHEALEMLGDPSGNRLWIGKSLIPEQGAVRYLVEMCDPCEAFTYDRGGVAVSDFITPKYHHPHSVKAQTFSFLGRLSAQREVAEGGYLSWVTRDGRWWQRTFFGGSGPQDQDISGRLARLRGQGSLRAAVDRVTVEARLHVGGE